MSDTPSSESVAAAINAYVAQIVAAAEREALELQQEIEHATTARATAVRLEAEQDADRIRAEAEVEARAYLEDTRLRIDAFASARVGRISDLTDALLARAEAIQHRLGDAIDLQAQLRDLVTALAAAARAATAEGSRPPIRLPGVARIGQDPEARPQPAIRHLAERARPPEEHKTV